MWDLIFAIPNTLCGGVTVVSVGGMTEDEGERPAAVLQNR